MASKADNLLRAIGGNISASVGRRPTAALHGARPAPPAAELAVRRATNVVVLPIGLIDPDPGQPREEFGEDDESLDQLSASLAEQGQLQTVVVYEEGGRYMLVCGERRWRAARKAGLEKVNATVLPERPDGLTKIVLQYTENRQRKAFTRNEEAKVYRAMMESFGLSKAEVARRLSVSESEVSRALAVDEKLPEDVRGKVAAGAIAVSVAYELTKVADPDRQRALAALAEQGATREEVAAEVKRARTAAGEVVARRKAPASRRPGGGRKEFALAGGGRVTLTGPAAVGPGAWVAALREALTLAEGEIVPAHREDQGEAA